MSYWLVQSERMVGHYAPQVRDREHIGHQYFNLLSIDESPCGQSLKTKKPLFFSEFHEAAKCVGSLATWPVLDSGGDRGLAVLMLEARTQGFIQHHPDTSLFLSNLAQCFGLLSVFIMARGFDRADPQSPVATTVPVNSMAVPSNNLTNAK